HFLFPSGISTWSGLIFEQVGAILGKIWVILNSSFFILNSSFCLCGKSPFLDKARDLLLNWIK
ncbi:MAG TPA: hypothetical protein PLS70_22930, partial [Acidobacteriota bacterium]|nr:hypothetical protein [Acidobacteriota bacterium]